MIPVNEPLLNGNEKKYLALCIDTGWISSEGPFVQKLEQEVAKVCGRQFGIAVANGSVALDVALAALDLPAGSEVLVPTFTIISCAAAIVRAGLIPVGIDADPLTWNLNLDTLESKITSKTRAIMPVHIYGIPVDMDRVLALSNKHDLKIIEDAAEQIGQTVRGKPCGGFGELSTLSFYPNKHITTGEGGMVLTDNPELAERCRSFRNLCFQPKRRFFHEELGWNFRMSNLQAAIGVAQTERLPEFLKIKRQIGRFYNECLSGLEDFIQTQPVKTEYAENIYWVYGVLLKERVPFDAIEAMQKLGNLGIGTRPFFYPMHQQPIFKKLGYFKGEHHPVADRLAQRGFYLPSGLALTQEQMTQAASALRGILCP